MEFIHAEKAKPLATVEVQVDAEGQVPPLQVEPKFLASALSIGDTLCFIDSMSPLVVRNRNTSFAVVMPMRLTVLPDAPAKEEEASVASAA